MITKKFAADLIDENSGTTFAIAGLVTKSGVDFFTRVFGENWTNASPEVQSALLTTFYKRGEAKMAALYPDPTTNGDTSLGDPGSPSSPLPLPDPTKADGGPFVLNPSNFQHIQDALAGQRADGSFVSSTTPALTDPTDGLQIQNVTATPNGFTVSLANFGVSVAVNADGSGFFQTAGGARIDFGADDDVSIGKSDSGSPKITIDSSTRTFSPHTPSKAPRSQIRPGPRLTSLSLT